MQLAEKEKMQQEFASPVNVFTLREYIGNDDDVRDPYGGTPQDYETCYEQLMQMTERLAFILKQEEP